MTLLPAPILFMPLDDAPVATVRDILVRGVSAATAPADSRVQADAPVRSAAASVDDAAAPPPPSMEAADAAPASAATADPGAAASAPAASPTIAATASPTFVLPPEDAFPSLAELDAILAAHAGPAAGPDADDRAAAAALLGLDPALAEDAGLFAAIIGGLPDPDGDALFDLWLSEAESEAAPPPEWPEPNGDWQVG